MRRVETHVLDPRTAEPERATAVNPLRGKLSGPGSTVIGEHKDIDRDLGHTPIAPMGKPAAQFGYECSVLVGYR